MLAWLTIALQELHILEDDEDLTEPPVPAGLQKLSPTLRNFVSFFEIDMDVVNAATSSHSDPRAQLSTFLDKLPDDEKLDTTGEKHPGLPGMAHCRHAIINAAPAGGAAFVAATWTWC